MIFTFLIFNQALFIIYTTIYKLIIKFSIYITLGSPAKRKHSTWSAFFVLLWFRTLIDPSSKCNRILNRVRISDESRSLLARKRLGRNSSVRSLPIKYGSPQIFDSLAWRKFACSHSLNWENRIRISDESRSLLARKRLGRNSSLWEPSRLLSLARVGSRVGSVSGKAFFPYGSPQIFVYFCCKSTM